MTNTIKSNLLSKSLVGALRNLGIEVIEGNGELVDLMMSIGSYNRNPCEKNTLQNIVMDDLSPQKMESSMSMVKMFIRVTRCPEVDIKGIVHISCSNKTKKEVT